MALRELLNEGNQVVSTIFGDYTGHYDPIGYVGFLPRRTFLDKVLNRMGIDTYSKKYYQADFVCRKTDDSVNRFLSIYEKYIPLRKIYDMIHQSDAVVMNGEGTFIYTLKPIERYDLKYYLFILALAQRLGKKTFLVNAMFSDSPVSPRNEFMIQESKTVFEKCDLIIARDPMSYAYYKRNILDKIKYVPDALFTWKKFLPQYKDAVLKMPLLGMTFPEYPEKWHCYDSGLWHTRYVVVSGSSLASYYTESVIDKYVILINELKKKYQVLIALTCGGDWWLEKVARETNTPWISVKTNMLYAYSVLCNASVFISGRWHPSILASLGGTPCVFFNSNSHKTLALQKMLQYKNPQEYDTLNLNISMVSSILDDVAKYISEGINLRRQIQQRAFVLSDECNDKMTRNIK